MERFFDLFAQRQIASDLFAIAEDTRIDTAVRREYDGIRRAWRRTQENELESRRLPNDMPLREALVENLIRASLDGAHTMIWPKPLQGVLAEAIRVLFQVKEKNATVEDAAEATLSLYDIVDQGAEHPAVRARRDGLGDRQRRLHAAHDVAARRGRRRRRPADAHGRRGRLREPRPGRLPRRLQARAGPTPHAPPPQRGRGQSGRLALAAHAGAAQGDARKERRDHRRRDGRGRPGVDHRPLPLEPGEGGRHAHRRPAGAREEGRPARRRGRRGRRRAARRGQVVLLRRVGLPRRRLQAALVPRPRSAPSKRAATPSSTTRSASTRAGQRDAQAVRAAQAGDVPQDQAPARRRGVRPRRRHRLRDRAPGRPQLHRQGLLAPQQGRARRRRRVPARHERLDRRGD